MTLICQELGDNDPFWGYVCLCGGSLGFSICKRHDIPPHALCWNGSSGWCSGLRLLQQKAAESAPLFPLQPWWARRLFCLILLHWPSQAAGSNSAVTWFCAKSAALCLLGEKAVAANWALVTPGTLPVSWWAGTNSLTVKLQRPHTSTPPPTPPPRLHFWCPFVIHRTSCAPGLGETGLQTNKEPS